MSGYNAGTAFLQIVPSFKGVVTGITAEAAKWGTEAGKAFKDSFEAATKGLAKDSLGPSPEESAQKGAEAGGAFADGFKAKVDAAIKSLPDATIGADATPAERKIAEVRAKLVELSSKRIGVDIDDKAALAELDALKVDLKRIGASSPNVRVKVDAAAALAELEAVKRASKDTGDSFLSKLTPGANAAAGGMSGLTKAALALGPALVPIGGVLLAGLAGALPLVAGLATGFGAIALAAKPAFSQVETAVKSTTAAQQAYNKAVAEGNSKAAAKALLDEQAALAGLSPTLKAAATAWLGFDNAYHAWAAKFQPQLFSIMASGLNIAKGAFAALTPIVSGSLGAIQRFMPELKGAIDGPNSPFGKFAQFMSTEAPKAIDGFLQAMLSLGEGFGNLIQALAPLGNSFGNSLGKFAADFVTWSQNLESNQGFQHFAAFVKESIPTVTQFLKNLGGAFVGLVSAAAPVGKAILDVFNAFADGFKAGGGGAALKTFADKLASVLENAGPLATTLGTTLSNGIASLAKALGKVNLGTLVSDLTTIARVAGPGFMSGFSSVFAAAAPALTIIVGNIAQMVKDNPKVATWAAALLGGAVAIGKIASALKLAKLGSFVTDAVKLTGAMLGLEGVAAVLAFGGLVAAAAAALYIVTHQKQIKDALAQSPVPNTTSAVKDQPASNSFLGIPKIVDNAKQAVAGFLPLVDKIVAGFGPLGDQIAGFFTNLGKAAENAIPGLTQAIAGILPLFNNIVAGFGPLADQITGFFTNLGSAAAALPGQIGGALAGLGGIVGGAFSAAFAAASGAVSTGVSAVVGFFSALPGQAAAVLSALGGLLGGIFGGALSAVEGIVSGGVAAVVGFFAALPGRAVAVLSALGGMISGVASSALAAMGGAVSSGIGAVIGFFAGIPGRAVAALAALAADLAGVGSRAMSALAGAISGGIGAVVGAIGGIAGDIVNVMASLPGDMVSIGENIVGGIVSGIDGAAGSIFGALSGIASSALGHAKSILGINSPAKVMIPIGSAISEGIAVGIDQGGRYVTAAQQRMAALVTVPIDARVNARGSVDLSGVGMAGALAGGSSAPISVNVTAYDPAEAARKTAAEIGWQQKTRGR